MKTHWILPVIGLVLASAAFADDALETLQREVKALTERVAALEQANAQLKQELVVERLVVKKELIVSDTGKTWEEGFEEQAIPRGIYARSLYDGPGGLWVRSRLIKGEIDDPFDDRFHALERDGSIRTAPGHISWNAWIGGAWRQMAIIQGEGLDGSEIGKEEWSGGNHPGRVRIQSFRPHHDEPLTDALIGQGKMSLGGGGFGGGGLPYPAAALELWGGEVKTHALPTPDAPKVLQDDGSGRHEYAVMAVGSDGARSMTSAPVKANGLAKIQWDSVPGGDAYIVLRDGKELMEPFRADGSQKMWEDAGKS